MSTHQSAIRNPQSALPITYPARPLNGGRLEVAQPKSGTWAYEPKLNGWRALVHAPTGAMWNRHGERLSIEAEFRPVLDRLRLARDEHERCPHGGPVEWLDCEALERRIPLGRGSLIVLDAPTAPGTYAERMQQIHDVLVAPGIALSWKQEHEPPPANSLLTFAYTYTDYGIAKPERLTPEALGPEQHFDGEELDGIWSAWVRMQAHNRRLGCELFEGFVAKRTDSTYPVQLHQPTREFPGWMKHRFV